MGDREFPQFSPFWPKMPKKHIFTQPAQHLLKNINFKTCNLMGVDCIFLVKKSVFLQRAQHVFKNYFFIKFLRKVKNGLFYVLGTPHTIYNHARIRLTTSPASKNLITRKKIYIVYFFLQKKSLSVKFFLRTTFRRFSDQICKKMY